MGFVNPVSLDTNFCYETYKRPIFAIIRIQTYEVYESHPPLFQKFSKLLHNALLESFTRREHVLVVFFDLKKAFDTVWRTKILDQLQNWQIQGRLFNYIYQFLQGRSFAVYLGNTLSSQKSLANGVPQSAVLSPTLFNIAINSLTNKVHSPTKAILFADDLAILNACKSVTIGETVIQHTIDRLGLMDIGHRPRIFKR